MKNSDIDGKFSLFKDLGTLIVPENYIPRKLDSLDRKNFFWFDPFVNDMNYSKPIRILKPNMKIRVKIFKHNFEFTLSESEETEITSSEERISFLENQESVIYTGVQGLLFVFEQKADQFPKNFWYSSFETNIYNSEKYLPNLAICSDGKLGFGHHPLNKRWDPYDLLVSFYEFEA